MSSGSGILIIETKLKIKSGKPALELYSLVLEPIRFRVGRYSRKEALGPRDSNKTALGIPRDSIRPLGITTAGIPTSE